RQRQGRLQDRDVRRSTFDVRRALHGERRTTNEEVLMKLTGAQILWEALVREGGSDVFGYPGGAILPAYDAMLGYPIRHVLVRHEQGATHMADGYARASGKAGGAI